MPTLYTLGHSNHSLERFFELLQMHEIKTVADVRSHPYSLYCPHFNREALARDLVEHGFGYRFFGRELGARTDDESCFFEGRVDYARLSQTALYREGIAGLVAQIETERVTLVCAEKDPLTCHRTILIARELRTTVGEIHHILETGEIETQREAELRLLTLLKMTPNLFQTEVEQIEDAYNLQGKRIAYRIEPHTHREKSSGIEKDDVS